MPLTTQLNPLARLSEAQLTSQGMTSYLDIVDMGDSPSGKTKVWFIYSHLHGDVLGEVRWMGRWRQYSLFVRPDTIWNDACLREVADFLIKANSEHRAARQAQL